jgi:hypothetical protein
VLTAKIGIDKVAGKRAVSLEQLLVIEALVKEIM